MEGEEAVGQQHVPSLCETEPEYDSKFLPTQAVSHCLQKKAAGQSFNCVWLLLQRRMRTVSGLCTLHVGNLWFRRAVKGVLVNFGLKLHRELFLVQHCSKPLSAIWKEMYNHQIDVMIQIVTQ